MNPLPRRDEKRKRWQLNRQRDGERRGFYSTTPGDVGARDVMRQAKRWELSGKVRRKRIADCWDAYKSDLETRGGAETLTQRRVYWNTTSSLRWAKNASQTCQSRTGRISSMPRTVPVCLASRWLKNRWRT